MLPTPNVLGFVMNTEIKFCSSFKDLIDVFSCNNGIQIVIPIFCLDEFAGTMN